MGHECLPVVTKRRADLGVTLLAIALAGCNLPIVGTAPAPATAAPPTQSATSTRVDVLTPSPTAPETPTPLIFRTSTFTAIPSPTLLPSATQTASPEPPPKGFVLVPDVLGMPYSEARGVILASGLTYLRRDILDLEQPFGNVVGQEPLPGAIVPEGRTVILYAAFQAHAMWVGENCYPLRITVPSGRLLFYVSLDETSRYEVATDFWEGFTKLYDYRMIELASFENRFEDRMLFTPEVSGLYVIGLGPYQVNKRDIEAHPGGLPAGCLWVREIE